MAGGNCECGQDQGPDLAEKNQEAGVFQDVRALEKASCADGVVLEAVVHASADDAEFVADVAGGGEAVIVLAAEIDIEIFGLD